MNRLLSLIFAALGGTAFAADKPNILLILADDLAWSDLGCYGSEIRTPHLDALAKDGLRLTQFYNSARCSPTRASLLTGLHPHQAGFPNLSGTLPKHCATIPEVLTLAGYRSYMVGKWHLNEKNPPTERGFNEFYGMLGGYNSFWKEDGIYSRLPQGRERRVYAKDEFYATDVFADYAVDFISDDHKSGQPWFMYLAFNAPHFPLHAPEADIGKYEAMYFEKGWDRIREDRLARMKDLGLVPRDLALTPRSNVPANGFNKQTGWADKDNPAWDSLPKDRRRDLARRMAVYAAMVDRMDAAIGRVVTHLKTTGQLDNTVLFFLSDNGACAEWDPWGFDKSSGPQNILHRGDDLKTVGGPGSYISYGSAWANACNTPFRLYKHYNHEGGIRSPFIVHWPAGLKAKGLAPGPGYITDFMPTICALTGATYPKERDGTAILPEEGVSLLPAFRGEPLPERKIFIEHEGNRSVRDGDWKLVALHDQPWELYHHAADPTEMHDLAAREPQRVQELAGAWDEWAERCNVREKRRGKAATAEPATPQIANRPITIQCDVDTNATDGVILAHGGRELGYALHLARGHPVFTVRSSGAPVAITAETRVSGKFSLRATLSADAGMALFVNGSKAAEGKAPTLIPRQPKDGLSICKDDLTAVGDYTAPNALEGKITNVKIFTE
jgi:arylsulfatase A-like enzyme